MSFFNWPPPRWMWKYTLGDLNSKVGYGIFDVAVVWSLSHVWLFCSPTDCSPPGSSVHGISQARILECALRFLLQGIFPTQGSKLCLLHWQVDSLLLSHQTASKHPFGGISVLKIPKGRGGVFSVSSPSQLRGILFTRSTSPSWATGERLETVQIVMGEDATIIPGGAGNQSCCWASSSGQASPPAEASPAPSVESAETALLAHARWKGCCFGLRSLIWTWWLTFDAGVGGCSLHCCPS